MTDNELNRWPWLENDEGERQRAEERERREAWIAENKEAVARMAHLPATRQASTAAAFAGAAIGQRPDPVASTQLVTEQCAKVRDGDLGLPTDILTSQAMTLDAVFSEMLRRAAANLGEYPEAASRYMGLAMKAQAQCRTTIEALGKLTRGGEQVVKHVHIDNRGGQAVVTETVHTGGAITNAAEQPRVPGHEIAQCAPLLGSDPSWHGMPVSGDAERQVSHSRRQVAGGADGQPECVEARRPISRDGGSGPLPQ